MADAGTAQNIPVYAKIIITIICLVAVVLTAAWGKVMDAIKGGGKKKAAAAPQEKK